MRWPGWCGGSGSARAAGVLAGLLVLPGCSGSPEPAPPPLTGAFEQGRSQVEGRTAKVLLTLPDGAPPVRVTRLEMVLPGLESAGATDEDLLLDGGRTVALTSTYGRATCADADAPGREALDREAPRAVLALEGRAEPLVLALADDAGQAARIRDRECQVQRVAELAPAAWRDEWGTEGTGGDLVPVGRLDVGPVTGDEPVTVVSLTATPLFTYEAAGLPAEVAPGERLVLDVRLVPRRCDPHAVAEDKLGFAPPVTVRVGGEELAAPVWVPREQRAEPLAALGVRCGTT